MALTPAAGKAPTMPLTPGSATAQLPKATIALTPTQPLGTAAPVSSIQASFNAHPVEEEETDKVLLTLSIVAVVVCAALLFIQVSTDMMSDRIQPGWFGSTTQN